MKQIIIAAIMLVLMIPISASAQEQSNQTAWLTHEDRILQFSIEYPSTWNIIGEEDMISFQNPERTI
jgi:hypothetical protein